MGSSKGVTRRRRHRLNPQAPLSATVMERVTGQGSSEHHSRQTLSSVCAGRGRSNTTFFGNHEHLSSPPGQAPPSPPGQAPLCTDDEPIGVQRGGASNDVDHGRPTLAVREQNPALLPVSRSPANASNSPPCVPDAAEVFDIPIMQTQDDDISGEVPTHPFSHDNPVEAEDMLRNYSTSMLFQPDVLDIFDPDGTNLDTDDFGSDSDSSSSPSPVAQQSSSTPLSARDLHDIETASSFLTVLRKKLSKNYFLGILTIYGQSRFSLKAYRHLLLCIEEHAKWPSGSTVRLTLLPFLLDKLTVKSQIVSFPSKGVTSPAPAPDSATTSPSAQSAPSSPSPSPPVQRKSSQSVVVLPSDWARMDISTYHTFSEIVCSRSCRCSPKPGSSDIRIECSSHVRDKHKNSMKPVSLWVCREETPYQAPAGTRVSLLTYNDQQLPLQLSSKPFLRFHKRLYKKELCNHFDADVLCTFVVECKADSGLYFSRGVKPLSSCNLSTFIDQSLSFLTNFFDTGSTTTSEQMSVSNAQTVEENNDSLAEFNIRVGDHLTFLQVPDDEHGEVLVVFLNKFWPSRLDGQRQFILFLHSSGDNRLHFNAIPSFGVPLFVSDSKSRSANVEDNNGACMTTGQLPDGERFYMYRILLYADDFNARSALFPRGSVGGVYMTPAGFSVKSKRSQKTIRTLAVTPSGVSSNHILDFIIDDLVGGSLDGFPCTDPSGNAARCFFDIIGFVADYPASSGVVDVLGHMAFNARG